RRVHRSGSDARRAACLGGSPHVSRLVSFARRSRWLILAQGTQETSTTDGCHTATVELVQHHRADLGSASGLRTPRPNPWCGDLKFGEGPTRRQIQGTKIWPAKCQVAHHFWRLDNTDDLSRGRNDPDAAGANAPHPPYRIDFDTVRDPRSR